MSNVAKTKRISGVLFIPFSEKTKDPVSILLTPWRNEFSFGIFNRLAALSVAIHGEAKIEEDSRLT